MINSDTKAHHVFHSGDDLCKHQLCFQVVQLPPAGDSGEQVPAAAILHHQIQPSGGLYHLVKAHNVGVAQLLHAADLTGGQRLALLVLTQLVNNFNSNSLCKQEMRGRSGFVVKTSSEDRGSSRESKTLTLGH